MGMHCLPPRVDPVSPQISLIMHCTFLFLVSPPATSWQLETITFPIGCGSGDDLLFRNYQQGPHGQKNSSQSYEMAVFVTLQPSSSAWARSPTPVSGYES